jgi:hypothetical protein
MSMRNGGSDVPLINRSGGHFLEDICAWGQALKDAKAKSRQSELSEPARLARKDAIDALLSLGHSVFPSLRQGMQSRPRKEWQVRTRGVDAHTPARPLTHWHDVVSAIAAGFGRCHRRAPKKPPFRLNVATDTEVQIHFACRPVFRSGLPARSGKPTQATNNLTVTETCAVGLGYA